MRRGAVSTGTGLTLTGVDVRLCGAPILHGIDLGVADGEIVAVVGPSGCGASTLVRVAAGLTRAAAGAVHRRAARERIRVVDGLDPRPRIGRVTAAISARAGSGVDAAHADAALHAVGLGHRAGERVTHLCRGDRQRLALAQALAGRPALLILDDPLSALHATERAAVRDRIVEVLRTQGVTTLWATRDPGEAVAVADRVAVLVGGRILALGSPEDVYARAADPAVAAVLGPVSAVPGIVDGNVVDVWGQQVPLAADAHDGHCEVVVRPENVLLVERDAPGVDAVVEHSTFLGTSRHSLVRAVDGTLVHVQHPAHARLQGSERVRIALAPVPVLTRPPG